MKIAGIIFIVLVASAMAGWPWDLVQKIIPTKLIQKFHEKVLPLIAKYNLNLPFVRPGLLSSQSGSQPLQLPQHPGQNFQYIQHPPPAAQPFHHQVPGLQSGSQPPQAPQLPYHPGPNIQYGQHPPQNYHHPGQNYQQPPQPLHHQVPGFQSGLQPSQAPQPFHQPGSGFQSGPPTSQAVCNGPVHDKCNLITTPSLPSEDADFRNNLWHLTKAFESGRIPAEVLNRRIQPATVIDDLKYTSKCVQDIYVWNIKKAQAQAPQESIEKIVSDELFPSIHEAFAIFLARAGKDPETERKLIELRDGAHVFLFLKYICGPIPTAVQEYINALTSRSANIDNEKVRKCEVMVVAAGYYNQYLTCRF